MDLRKGVVSIAIGSLFSALTGVAFFEAQRIDSNFSCLSGSFIRVLVNLLVAFAIAGPRRDLLKLRSPRHRTLWAWSFFGGLTVITFFAGIGRVGNGMIGFLSAASGVFIAGLAPLVARQESSMKNWIAILGSIFGMALLCGHMDLALDMWIGYGLGVASGFFCALACLMIARSRTNYAPATIMIHWTVGAVFAHMLGFLIWAPHWPHSTAAIAMLVLTGISGGLSQYFTTIAYQSAPASLVASLSYASPLLSVIFDVWYFDISFTTQNFLGLAVISAFGVFLPLRGANLFKRQRATILRMERPPEPHWPESSAG